MSMVIGDEDNGWWQRQPLTAQERKLVNDVQVDYALTLEKERALLGERNTNYYYPNWAPPVSQLPERADPVHSGLQYGPEAIPSATATSPKALDSSHKIPVNLCPASAIIAISLVIAQGHKKPGRTIYNWRTQPISYSAYLGAAMRHILKSNDGSDFDKELSELAGVPVRHDWAAMSCLAIIEDARQAGTLVDDRPVKGGAEEFLESLMVKK